MSNNGVKVYISRAVDCSAILFHCKCNCGQAFIVTDVVRHSCTRAGAACVVCADVKESWQKNAITLAGKQGRGIIAGPPMPACDHNEGAYNLGK